MADVQVGLGAVVGDEHLTVLEGVHRAGVDVQVRVELLHHDAQAPGLEQHAEAGGGEPLAQRGGDTPGDEDVLGRRRFGRHGQEGAPVVAVWGAVRSSSAPVVPGVVGGAVAAVPGFFSHRSTGYQRISASGRRRPATLRARPDTQVGPSRFPHPVVTRSADPGCPERHTDHLRASYPARTFAAEPARRHGTTPRPSAAGTTRARQFVEQQLSFGASRLAARPDGCFASSLNEAWHTRPTSSTHVS
ncbi:hypothetical protein SVIOM342S_05427 [Streptomyces violaceorubidus]